MKKSRVSKRALIFAVLLLVAILCGTWLLLPDTGKADPNRAVQEAWKRIQQVGRYEFSTTLEQTTYPAPRLTNVGRSSTREVYHITGVANLPEDSLMINLYQNDGSLMNRRDGIEIRIQDGKASGRLTGLDWTDLDSFSASGFAPGNDAASFLSAADNVRFLDAANLSIPLESQTLHVSASHYSFDLNPDLFAEVMRQQMIQELQRAGKLPAGMTLGASERYRQMVASGEVWIDADGLPVRMKINMQFPQEKSGEKVSGVISTDFYNHQRDQLLARRGLPWRVAGAIGLPLNPRQMRQQALTWEATAIVLLLLILMLVYTRKRTVYACVASLIIFTMLASPVWQGAQASAFAKEMKAQQEQAQASQQAQKQEQDRLSEVYGGNWDPHLSPLKLAQFNKALNAIASPHNDDQPLSLDALANLNPKALQQEGEEEQVDTDKDGLSDSFEKEFWPDTCPTGPDPAEIPEDCVLNPQDADTDNDGLSDNEEVNLNTHPNNPDTDADGILDPYEVQGFHFEGDPDAHSYFETNNYWYSNPELRDTDGDGQPDGSECPQRVKQYDDPPDWQPSVCQDTDGDLLPDIFDRDDDDDGVPTSVDASPYDYYSEVYSRSNPFKMRVTPVVTDTDKTVFITYQILPTNPEHLTYAMNVLDWPTGDVDGQIMRVNDTTFGEDLTEEQLAQDPKASYGDMRLIPMLEVRLTGDSLPLPMTSTLSVPISGTLFSDGEFLLTGSAGYTQIELTKGPAGTYPVYLGEGSCSDIYNFSKLGDLDVGGGGQDASTSLKQFAGGGHVVYIMNPAENKINACADIEPVAHGVSQNTIVDTSFLEAYGGSARNDFDGSVLVYTPLQLMSDLDGGAPVAFQSRVPFTTAGDGFSNSVQEVRAVWLLNMLTDICRPQPEDWDYKTDGDWCTKDNLDRWDLDTPRIVQTYGEEFNLIGVTAQVDWGVEMAVLFEDPALDPYPEYDDPLWGLARSMEGSFAAGRDSDKDGQRDVTVDTLVSRFDPDFNNCSAYTGDPADAPYIYREDYYEDWGLPCNAFQTWRGGYDFADGVYDFISHQVKDEIFAPYFNVLSESERPQFANLLFARETSARSLGFGDSACSNGVCNFDFSGQPVNTQAVMNWAPYQRDGDEWSSYPLEEYLDLMEANLRKLDSYKPSDDTEEAKKIIDGQIAVARLNYEAMYNGLAMLVAVNGEAVYNKWQIFEDSYIYNDFYRLNAKAQIVTKVVSGLVQMLVDTYYVCPMLYNGLFKNATTIGAKIDRFFVLFKDGVGDKLSSLNKLISNRFAKIAIGIGVGLLIIAVAVMATFYLINPDTTAGKVGGRILFSAIGLLTGILAVKALVDGIKAFQALPKTLDTISKLASAASKGAQAAAIIGVIIGALITWGVFFASWGMSGKGFGSLEVNSMIAQAIAATITLLIFAALSATLVGAIIVAIIGIIDALIAIICAATGANELEEDHWARQYVCIGISGWVTKIIQWTIYSQTYMIDYADSERLDFTGMAQDLNDLALGMAVGNTISYTIDVSSVITLSDIPIDWKAAAFAWQYTDNIAKSTHFVYKIQPDNSEENNLDDGLERFDTVGWWDPDAGDETQHGWLDYNVDNHQFYQVFKAQTDDFSIAMPQPGINRDPVAYLSEGAAIPTQECIAIPVLIGIGWILIPECHIRTFRNTNHMDVSGSLTVDVFPATLDDFYSLAEIENRGYSFSWGRDANLATPDSADTTLRFPIFPDADGDGLKSPAFGGNDPNDADYDSDNDRLSDYYEVTHGSDPMLFDTDDDGLWDSDEIRLGADPTRKDSDGDGLPDEEELQGWLFTYGFESDGTPIETMVYSDPLNPDSDFDGLTDLMEKIYGFNPNVPSAASILDYELDLREWDSPQVQLRLDEGAGAALFSDSSNFAYEGVCEPTACPTSGLDGRYAKAVSMGGGDYISLPTSAGTISFDDNQPFTLAAWVSQPNGGTLISKWNEAADYKQEVIFDITAGGKLRLQKDGGSLSSSASVPSAQGTWTHVAVAFDGSTATFFINGEEDSSSSWSIAASTAISDSQVMVGGYMGASGPAGGYDGLIDEVAIYNRALSEEEVYHFLYQARYNFNDSFVRPGEKLTYKSVVENLLNSRFAYGLLTTLFNPREAILDWASKLLPRTFVLWPDNPVVTGVNTFEMSETIQIDPDYAQSGNLTITQTAKAQIVDRRTESNMAELWLKFNEDSGATEFEDSSGNMPPRNVSCSTCPTSGQTGIINNAIKFSSVSPSDDTPLQLPDLDRMNLTDYGYTFALWVKPASGLPSGSSVTLLKSDNNDRFVLNIRNSGGQYVPAIKVNNVDVPVSGLWRTIIPDVWSHLAIRYRSADSALDIFVNGARVDTISGNYAINANANLWLGGTPQSVDYWVDDLRIFSRPLGTLDINRLAERPVLKLTMDPADLHNADESVYSQSITVGSEINSNIGNPVRWAASVHGASLFTDPVYPLTIGFLKINGNPLLNMQDGAFTFSVWVKPDNYDTDVWQGIFGYNSGKNNAYPSLERRGQDLRFRFGNGSAPEVHEAGNVLTPNRWNHVVVTFQPSNVSGQYEYVLYVNAQQKASNIFDSKPTDNQTFFVGHSSHTYQIIAKNFYVSDTDGDAGSHVEVWIDRHLNGGSATRVFKDSNGDPVSIPKETWEWCSNPTAGCGYIDNNTYSNFESVLYKVWEDDAPGNPDDECGSVGYSWTSKTTSQTTDLSNGFHGTLYTSLSRESSYYTGLIDEMEVYRYALDSEQVFDLYNAIPTAARLPLDERPASDTFGNRAYVGVQDDGVCTEPYCPAAGTVGLINQAVRFDGVNDVIDVPNDPSSNPPVDTTSDFMFSLWFNTECPNCGLYSLWAGSSAINQAYLKSGNVCVKTGATEMCFYGGGLADAQWHHVVYTNNAVNNTSNLWLEGVIVNTVLNGATMPDNPNGQARLGYAPDAGSPYMNGQLDDVRIFRYSQAADIIAMLRRRAPLALFHLDEPDPASGFQDATAADWSLTCSSGECPQADMEGRLGRSVEFDGVNDRLRMVQNKLSDTTQSFSVAVWVMPTRDPVNYAQTLWVLPTSGNGAPKYSIVTAPDSLRLCVLTRGRQSATDCDEETELSNVSLIQNVWNHVVLTVQRTSATIETYKLYINGYEDSSGAGNSGSDVSDGLGRIFVGNKPSTYTSLAGGTFGGRIDEVSIYEYELNEIDVRDAFYYQMAQVEERKVLNLIIDAEEPQVELVSYNSGFPYVGGAGQQLQVNASDLTSGIGMVEMQVDHPNLPTTWQTAPLCEDSSGGTAFCPYFDPGGFDGKYKLSFRAVDLVGYQSPTPAYDFYVDKQGPHITSNQSGGALLAAELHPWLKHTWLLELDGGLNDPILGDSSPGSGVDLDKVKVTLFSEAGEVVGDGSQVPEIVDVGGGFYDWNLAYVIPEKEPTGKLKVVVEAQDQLGNPGRLEFSVLLDATPSRAKVQGGGLPEPDLAGMLSASTVDSMVLTSGTLSGEVSDVPADNIPYITLNGKAAASGVSSVETAFTPEQDFSFLFNEPYPDGLLAWLPLDGAKPPVDGEGNPDPDSDTRLFLDISPYQIAGECQNPNCPQEGLSGHKIGSIYFYGTGQNINLGQNVDLAGRSFTASIWAKRDAIDRNDPILWQGPVSIPDLRFLFGLNSENNFVCGFGGTDLVTPEAYPDTDWHYWGCTYDLDSGQRAIYRDGQQVASDYAAPIPSMYESLFIGKAPVGSFKGYLDELVIFDHALDAAEIRDQYTNYNTVFHLAVEESFYSDGDLLKDRSGYFQLAELQSGEDDLLNKVTAGKVGNYALALDGNDKLAVLPAYSLNPDRAAFTQSAWIYPSGAGERDVFSERDENPEMRYPSLILTADNRLKVGFGNFYNWHEAQTGPNAVPQDEWSFVAATFDGQTYRVYVNGEQALASTDLAGLSPYASERFNIGENFSGQIDDVRVYMRALSELEIQALMGIDWREADLQGSGSQANWTADLVQGLEGPYHLGVRGWDEQGHYDTGSLADDQWGGVVDTLAPRISMLREPDPVPTGTFTVTYTFSVEDTMLDEASILENMCTGEVELEREYYNSSWYLAKGVPPNSTLYRLSGQCQGDRRTLSEVGLYACDIGGNCSSATFPPFYTNFVYLPLVVSSGATSLAEVPPPEREAEPPEPARPPEGAQKLLERPLAVPDDAQAPRLEILTQQIGQADVRNLMTINLRGKVWEDNQLAWVKVRVLRQGSEIYATQAAVYGELWNALWVFVPGQAPQDGVYTLEATATDLAGNQTTLSQEFNVQLAPEQSETGGN